MAAQTNLTVGVWGGPTWMRSGLQAVLSRQQVTALDLGSVTDAVERIDAFVAVVRDHREALLGASRISETQSPTVCMVPNDEPDMAITLLRSGASGVLPFDCEPELIVGSLMAALQGLRVVSQATTEFLVALAQPTAILSEPEIAWLRQLAAGATVGEIAARASYSERTLYRLLAQCYRRLGVHGRAEAVAVAEALGVLADTAWTPVGADSGSPSGLASAASPLGSQFGPDHDRLTSR